MKNRIAEILKEKGMKKSVFADLTGIARQNVNLILSQKQLSISYENIQKICDVLDKTVEELFEIQRYEEYFVANIDKAKAWSVNSRWTNKDNLTLKLKKHEAIKLCEMLNEKWGLNKCLILWY